MAKEAGDSPSAAVATPTSDPPAAEVAEVTSAGSREVVGTVMAGEAGANMAREVREGAGAVMGAAVCWSKRLAVEWLRRRRPEPPT